MARALTEVGRYQIVLELGRGSMGVVYQGFDPVIGRTIAIKTLLTEGLSPLEFQEYKARFQREAQTAGVLTHPNIVTIYDFGDDNGVLYLAMEYLRGKSLEKVIEVQKVLPIETIIPMFEQVCGALDHAHAQKVVHRDIKPANIMILESGLVKVTDFGIAKMMTTGMTQAGQIIGTPNYMSPEHVRGRAVDGRSDIFSLGVILYELVTGEKPFSGQNITTVIYKIVNENPIPPRELDATIHPGLSCVITKALAKNPDERHQTCRELAGDLKNYKNLGGVGATSATVVLRAPQTSAAATETIAAPPSQPPPRARGAALQPPEMRETPIQSPQAREAPHPPPQARDLSPTPQVRDLSPQPPGVQTPPAQSVGATRVRPLSVHVIPPTKLQPEGISAAVWVFLAVLALGGLGGGYYFLHGRSLVKAPKNIPPQAAQLPAPPPAPKLGVLTVSANVSGAKISIDGRSDPDWVTPQTFPDLPVGPHQVVVSKEGYEEAQQTVTLGEGPGNSMKAQLVAKVETPTLPPAAAPQPVAPQPSPKPPPTPRFSQLVVTANIEGAKISIDGRNDPGWVTPHTFGNLAAGTHSVAVSKEGYDGVQRFVTLEPRGTQTTSVELSVPSGEINIVTIPPGAEVTIDDQPKGTSPVRAVVRVGQHTFTARIAGMAPAEGAFKIESGAIVTKKIDWSERPPATGVVNVHTNPPGATVSADGVPVGDKTPTSLRLPAGRHTLTISMAGYSPRQQEIDVPSNDTTAIEVTLSPQ